MYNLFEVQSLLDNILPKHREIDPNKDTSRTSSQSRLDVSFRLLRYSIYSISNNLLSIDCTREVLNWIIDFNLFHVIEQLVRMKLPTTNTLAANLLIAAVQQVESGTVQGLISLGVDVNTLAGPQRRSALYEATTLRDINMVKMLLHAGADPNITCGPMSTDTPLIEAISGQNNKELVRTLLNAGADANFAKQQSETALLKALLAKEDEIIYLLLSAKKVDVNAMTEVSMTPLQGAAKTNNMEILSTLLAKGADVDAPAGHKYQAVLDQAISHEEDDHLLSPIQHAASSNNSSMVRLLLDWGAKVDGFVLEKTHYIDQYGDGSFPYTPLQFAANNENTELSLYLLSKGAKVDGLGYGPTPLQIATGKDNIELVTLLLQSGANVNAEPWKYEGRTALQAAVNTGSRYLIKTLLDAGANANAPPALESGLTAIQEAVDFGDLSIMAELAALGADVNAPGSVDGSTCLELAAINGDLTMVQTLLKLGAQVNVPVTARNQTTPLQVAFKYGSFDVAKTLLAAGADSMAIASILGANISEKNLKMVEPLLSEGEHGETGLGVRLITAARIGAIETVLSLLNAGVDVNYTAGFSSGTALHAAVEHGHTTVTCILLDAKADINSVCKGGGYTGARTMRPLAIAADNNNLEFIQLLLSRGAKVNTLADDGFTEITALGTALVWFAFKGDIARALVKSGADTNKETETHGFPLAIAAAERDMGLVSLFLEAGADVNGTDKRGKTALQESARVNDIDIMQTLLRAGANANSPAGKLYGRTALQAAAEKGNETAVTLLLQHGADCNSLAAETRGVTALQAAAIKGHLRIAILLLEAGAHINTPAIEEGGRTALEEAAWHGRLDIVSLLLRNDTETEDGKLELRCKKAAKHAQEGGHPIIAEYLKGYKPHL